MGKESSKSKLKSLTIIMNRTYFFSKKTAAIQTAHIIYKLIKRRHTWTTNKEFNSMGLL